MVNNLASKIDHLSVEVQRLHHRFDKVEAEIYTDAVSPVWEDLDDVSLHRRSDNVEEEIEDDAASNAWQAVPTASAVAASNDGERNSSTSSWSAAAPPQNSVPDASQDTPVPVPVPEPRYQIPLNHYLDLGEWCNDCQLNNEWTHTLDTGSYATLIKTVFSDFQGAGIVHADGTVNMTWSSQPWSVAQSLCNRCCAR